MRAMIDAAQIMAEHGDDVLDYIESNDGPLPDVNGQGWSQMACTYLSTAVELWARSVESELEAFETDEEDAA